MDFTGLIGLLIGLFLIDFGITSGFTNLSAIKGFVDLPGMAVTLGGTVGSALLAFSSAGFKKIPTQLKITLQSNKYNPTKYIAVIVDFAKEARRKGLLSLEAKANELKDPFLKQSILLVVDAIPPERVKEMLQNEQDNQEKRHAVGWKFYEKTSVFALVFGFVDTLINIIKMGSGIGTSPEKLAAAFTGVLYGCILYLLLSSIGSKLQIRHQQETVCKEIIARGVIAIQAGENPKQIEEQLNAFLCQSEREKKE